MEVPKAIHEAMELEKFAMGLEMDLDSLTYNFKMASSEILNQLSKIRMRQGELKRTHGTKP